MKIQYRDQNLIVFESSLYRTTSCLFFDDHFTLITDPNFFPLEIEFIRKELSEHSRSNRMYLYFTHSDFDHIIGYGAFPGAVVIASQAFTENPAKIDILDKLSTIDDDFYVLRNYPYSYPKADLLIVEDFQRIQINSTSLTFLLASGHTRDSLFLFIEPAGIFICGDYLSNIEFPFIYHSFEAYLQTLEKARDLLTKHDVRILIPGHGDITQDPGEMQLRVNESMDYLHQIRESVMNGKEFNENSLWRKYHFPISMSKYHLDNLNIVSKELKKNP